jgi:hypothetical protein
MGTGRQRPFRSPSTLFCLDCLCLGIGPRGGCMCDAAHACSCCNLSYAHIPLRNTCTFAARLQRRPLPRPHRHVSRVPTHVRGRRVRCDRCLALPAPGKHLQGRHTKLAGPGFDWSQRAGRELLHLATWCAAARASQRMCGRAPPRWLKSAARSSRAAATYADRVPVAHCASARLGCCPARRPARRRHHACQHAQHAGAQCQPRRRMHRLQRVIRLLWHPGGGLGHRPWH